MKLSKTLLQAMMIAVTAGAIVSCTKSVDVKRAERNEKNAKTDSTLVIPDGCPACGMG